MLLNGYSYTWCLESFQAFKGTHLIGIERLKRRNPLESLKNTVSFVGRNWEKNRNFLVPSIFRSSNFKMLSTKITIGSYWRKMCTFKTYRKTLHPKLEKKYWSMKLLKYANASYELASLQLWAFQRIAFTSKFSICGFDQPWTNAGLWNATNIIGRNKRGFSAFFPVACTQWEVWLPDHKGNVFFLSVFLLRTKEE